MGEGPSKTLNHPLTHPSVAENMLLGHKSALSKTKYAMIATVEGDPKTGNSSEPVETRRITYYELYHEVRKAAHALLKMGVQPGESVVSFAATNCEMLIVFLATVASEYNLTPQTSLLPSDPFSSLCLPMPCSLSSLSPTVSLPCPLISLPPFSLLGSPVPQSCVSGVELTPSRSRLLVHACRVWCRRRHRPLRYHQASCALHDRQVPLQRQGARRD